MVTKAAQQPRHRHGTRMVRYGRFRTIERKKRIIQQQNNYWSFKHEGELSKGKIHCSCPMCRHKFKDQASLPDVRRSDAAIQEVFESGIRVDPFLAKERSRIRRKRSRVLNAVFTE